MSYPRSCLRQVASTDKTRACRVEFASSLLGSVSLSDGFPHNPVSYPWSCSLQAASTDASEDTTRACRVEFASTPATHRVRLSPKLDGPLHQVSARGGGVDFVRERILLTLCKRGFGGVCAQKVLIVKHLM